jgi:uncharacterized membrane protein YkoI
MRRRTLWIAAAVAAAALGGASVAAASNTLSGNVLQRASDAALNGAFEVVQVEGPGRDDDGAESGPPLSAADRDRAGQAALAKVGQGRVGEVERENEGGSAYEVEVILDDGSEVDVELGADFQVLNTGTPERD